MNEGKPASLEALADVLEAEGLHGALAWLNGRTPHRFTGLYRFDGDTLRNIAHYDQFDPTVERGDDAPLRDTYCGLVGAHREDILFGDIATEARLEARKGPVVSYCGVLLTDASGAPFGTLCHYDLKRCEERQDELKFLSEAGPLLYRAMKAKWQQADTTGLAALAL